MTPDSRSLDVCIYNLRRKLQLASPGWSYIETCYGVGYRLIPERIKPTGAQPGSSDDEQPGTAALAA